MSDRTYSSYDLDEFQRCPKLFDLKHRWREPDNGFNVNTSIGAAVSVGLAARRHGKSIGDAENEAGVALLARWTENDEWSLEGVLKHVRKGIELGMSTNLGLKTILAADDKKYGRCRPDLVGRMPNGKLRVVDDKVKLRLDLKYLDETLAEYQVSNQLYEYAWEAGRFYNEPVSSVGINLIILSPKATAVFYPMTLTEEAVAYWSEGATEDFRDMELIEERGVYARPRWTSCRSKYNKPGTFEKELCKFWTICHDLHGDESKAEVFYERR